MAEAQAPSTSGKQSGWKEWHAFGLPGGSVRALLALCVAGTIAAALLLCPERQVPYYSQNVLFIILGHYFAARKQTSPAADAGPPPLYLPRGSIRLLLTAGFVAVGVMLYRQERLLRVAEHPGVLTLYLVLGFLLGVVLTRVLSLGRRHPPRLVEDLRALLSLVAAVLLAFMVLEELELLPRSGALGSWYQLLAERRAQHVAAALVSFYFGSRS